MTNSEIMSVALRQSAIDCGCKPRDFWSGEVRAFVSRWDERARKYLKMPLACDLVSYGHGLVISGREDVIEEVREYAKKYPAEECFTFPAVNELSAILAAHGLAICHTGMYFLPDSEKIRAHTCPYETRLLEQSDFQNLYREEWANALCEKRRELDRLCAGAYDGDTLIGLAGASADAENMWQIGVDVLPACRGRGVAAAITSRLALAILERGIVPFYGCLWANVASQRNALRCGFRPAWMQLSAAEPCDEGASTPFALSPGT